MKCYIKIGIIIVIRFTLHSTRPHDNDNGNDHAVVVKLKGNCSTMEKQVTISHCSNGLIQDKYICLACFTTGVLI